MSSHSGTVLLTNGATRQSEHYTFYVATEGESLSGQDNVRAPWATTIPGCWDGPTKDFAESAARWRTISGSATSPDDFTAVVPPTDSEWNPPRPGETQRICNDQHDGGCTPPRSTNPAHRPLPVQLVANSTTDEAVRSLEVELTAAKIWGDLHPENGSAWSSSNTSFRSRKRTLHIVDDDGPNRFSLEPTVGDASVAVPYSRREFGSSLELWIPVFRAGGSNGPNPAATSVDYALVPSGEHPATPASGSNNNDFRDLTNGIVEFPASWTTPNLSGADAHKGPRLSWIEIRLYRDFIGEHDETFDVVLSNPNNPGGATSTRITILDSDGGPDNGPPPGPEMHPSGKLHHPKRNYKYPQNYPFLNEIHLFTMNARKIGYRHPEYPDWRVEFAELAIRKRFKGGKCVWWTGNGFTRRGCASKLWFRMQRGGDEDYFLYRITKPLPRSVGKSRVRDYKVWSRWFDTQANESTLRKGKNMNLFEVLRASKACKKNPFGRQCKPIRPKR